MSRYFYGILLSFLLTAPLKAQGIADWQAYTSFRSVQDIASSSLGDIFVSTLGGIYTQTESGTQTYTTIEGMDRIDSRQLVYDEATNKLYIGYIDGGIDVLDLETGEFTLLEDIRRVENFNSKTINDFVISERNLYVATDFGIVNYNLDNQFVLDSFTKLGDLNRGLPVLDIDIADGRIFAATSEGVAEANLNDDLEFAQNWTSYDASNGFVTEIVQTLAYFNGLLYASTASANYQFDGLSWTNSVFNQGTITKYEASENDLFAFDFNQLFKLNTSGQLTDISTSGMVLTTLHSLNFDIVIGTLNQSISIYDNDLALVMSVIPDGPYQNLFDDIKLIDGTLIASSSSKSDRNNNIDRGKGYYIFQDGVWSNFNAQINETISAANYFQAFTTAFTDQYYYFGSWGRGIARHTIEDNTIQVFDETNSSIRGWEADDPLFPVISGLDTDSNGDVWAVSRWSQNPLYYQTPGDDDWVQLPPVSQVSASDEHFELFIDSFDQKWISLQSTTLAGRGLLVMRTGADPSDPSDDEGVKLTEDINQGFLPDLQVKAIVEDRNGEVWVGTERGIGRYIFPDLIIDGGSEERRAQFLINEDTTAISRILLRDVNVSTMAVNSANEKWIGSENQGVFLINAEGSRIEKQFNEENSPLFSNSITSIAIDETSGEVFIGTDRGLISFMDVPRQPVRKMEELTVYPNPFKYDQHNQILIDGLSEESVIRIVGSDGTLINQVNGFGGRISWDGRDFNGNRLGSGIYFIIALDENGSEKGVGKVAIIR